MTSTMMTLYHVSWDLPRKKGREDPDGLRMPKVKAEVFTIRERTSDWDCPNLREYFSLEHASRNGWWSSEGLAIAAELNGYSAQRKEADRREEALLSMRARRARRARKRAP